MANPPTLAFSATLPSGFTREYVLNTSGDPFVVAGGPMVSSSGFTRINSLTRSTGVQHSLWWRVETELDGDEIVFQLDATVTDGYRFIVDGQYINPTTVVSGSGNGYYRLTFPSLGLRRIVVEGWGNEREGGSALRFARALTKDDDQCLKPAGNRQRMIFVGDSNAELHAYPVKADSYAVALADYLGVPDLRLNASFGTGFVATNGGTFFNYAQRRADWTGTTYDILCLQMSINDVSGSVSNATLKSAIATEIAQARAANANAVIMVIGVLSAIEATGNTSAVTIAQGHETAANEAVNEANDPLVGFLPVINDGMPSVFTAGNLADRYSGLDGHGSPLANLNMARWLAQRMFEKFCAMAGVDSPVPAPRQVIQEITASNTAPSNPYVGQLWLDTST